MTMCEGLQVYFCSMFLLDILQLITHKKQFSCKFWQALIIVKLFFVNFP